MWSLKNKSLYYGIEEVEDFDTTEEHPLELKVSKNGEYAAVCNIMGKYADVFKYEEGHVFTLKKNTYRTDSAQFMFEFFECPKYSSRTLIIFNHYHGEIAVYDAEDGTTVHSIDSDDKFITSYKVINDEYLYVNCWYWNPIYAEKIYKLADLLTNEEYTGVDIDATLHTPVANGFKFNAETDTIEMVENNQLIHTYTLEDFYKNNKEYKQYQQNYELTRLLKENKNSLLYALNDDPCIYDTVSFEDNAKAKLDYILNSTDDHLISFACVGNNSGSDLREHAWNIAKRDKGDDKELNLLVPKLLFHGFTKNLPAMPEITLTFTFTRGETILKMVVKQKMKLMESGKDCLGRPAYEVDETEPCYITIS